MLNWCKLIVVHISSHSVLYTSRSIIMISTYFPRVLLLLLPVGYIKGNSSVIRLTQWLRPSNFTVNLWPINSSIHSSRIVENYSVVYQRQEKYASKSFNGSRNVLLMCIPWLQTVRVVSADYNLIKSIALVFLFYWILTSSTCKYGLPQ